MIERWTGVVKGENLETKGKGLFDWMESIFASHRSFKDGTTIGVVVEVDGAKARSLGELWGEERRGRIGAQLFAIKQDDRIEELQNAIKVKDDTLKWFLDEIQQNGWANGTEILRRFNEALDAGKAHQGEADSDE